MHFLNSITQTLKHPTGQLKEELTCYNHSSLYPPPPLSSYRLLDGRCCFVVACLDCPEKICWVIELKEMETRRSRLPTCSNAPTALLFSACFVDDRWVCVESCLPGINFLLERMSYSPDWIWGRPGRGKDFKTPIYLIQII